jgi:hypothetical protein
VRDAYYEDRHGVSHQLWVSNAWTSRSHRQAAGTGCLCAATSNPPYQSRVSNLSPSSPSSPSSPNLPPINTHSGVRQGCLKVGERTEIQIQRIQIQWNQSMPDLLDKDETDSTPFASSIISTTVHIASINCCGQLFTCHLFRFLINPDLKQLAIQLLKVSWTR